MPAFGRQLDHAQVANSDRITSHKSKLKKRADLALLVAEFWSDATVCSRCSGITSNKMLCTHLAQRVMKNGFYGQYIIWL